MGHGATCRICIFRVVYGRRSKGAAGRQCSRLESSRRSQRLQIQFKFQCVARFTINHRIHRSHATFTSGRTNAQLLIGRCGFDWRRHITAPSGSCVDDRIATWQLTIGEIDSGSVPIEQRLFALVARLTALIVPGQPRKYGGNNERQHTVQFIVSVRPT